MRATIILTFIFLSSCGHFKSEYSCNTVPGGVCKPLQQVYNDSINKRGDVKKPVENNGNVASSNQAYILDRSEFMPPILTGPEVLRVLYFSFENQENDLDGGGFVYLKVRESQWKKIK